MDKALKTKETDAGVMLFSKSATLSTEATPKGLGVKHVELVAKAFLEKYKGADDGLQVRVYPNEKDAFGRDATPDNVRVKGGYNPSTNTVVIIADNHESTTGLLHTLQHEIIVHKGLGLFDAQTEQDIIDAILVNAPKSRLLKPLWDQVQVDYADDSPRIQAEELLARVAQTDLSTFDKYWNKIVVALRRGLVKLGLIPKEMSRHDLMGVVYTMADAFKQGKRARPRDVGVATEIVEDVLAASWTDDEDDSSTVRYSKTQDDALLSQWQHKLLSAIKSKNRWFTIELEAPHVLKTLKVLSSIKLTRTRILAIKDRHPDVPKDVLMDLPNYLADPLVIYTRPKGDESTLVIEAMTKSGEPILIGLRDGEIKTITPKHNQPDKSGAQRLGEEINRGQVIYARDKKALDNARADLGNRTATYISNNRPLRGQGSRKKIVFKADIIKHDNDLISNDGSDSGGFRFSKTQGDAFDKPLENRSEAWIRKWQDRHLTLKRVIENIGKSGGVVTDAARILLAVRRDTRRAGFASACAG